MCLPFYIRADTQVRPYIMFPHLRYNSFTEILKAKFGEKVHRITLNANLPCPNRCPPSPLPSPPMGEGMSGCIFCNDEALLGKSWHKQQSIKDQIAYGINYIQWRHEAHRYIAYFQNGTNTNAPAEILRPLFFDSIADERIVGLIISTRPDCLKDDVLDLLSELNERTYLWLEMGLQSPFDETLKRINRGHSFDDYVKALEQLKARKILVCSHVILGLPGETRDQILDGTKTINALPLDGIKIHNLMILNTSLLVSEYLEGRYKPLALEEYATLCVDYLERLRPNLIIHRLNAHAPDRLTIAPKWSVNKLATLNAIHGELERRDARQGNLVGANLRVCPQ